MNKFFLLLILILGLKSILFAQNDKYNKIMKTQIQILDTAKSEPFLMKCNNTFERIADKEQAEWLPIYYASLSNFKLAMYSIQKDKEKADALLTKAMTTLQKAEELSKDNSEIVTLQAMITATQMSIDPMSRGQKLGMLASKLSNRAIELNPENPRAIAFKGQVLSFTPAQWGGNPEKGMSMLKEALEKVSVFKPESELHPTWGKEYIEESIKMIESMQGQK